ncbi:hypothetical protein [Streptomyces sp. NPDC007074]|uniref:hypothetical protein n=1 Tax=unclassified Streptomyces TaxID=2593676 RepID=UPI0033DF9DA9
MTLGPVLVSEISVVATAVTAMIGWKLHQYYRDRDHTREDLTEIARLLHRLHVRLQNLTDLSAPAADSELVKLRHLRVELQCAAGEAPDVLRDVLGEVVQRVQAYGAAVIPPTVDVTAAYLAALTLEDVPEQLHIPVLLKQAKEQDRAAAQALEVVERARQVVNDMRSS